MPTIEVDLLDLDETLLDTQEAIYQAMLFALSTKGFPPFTHDVFASVMGASLSQCYAALSGQDDPNVIKDLCNLHRDFQLDNQHLVKPFPHTTLVLQTLLDHAHKLAVVTTRHATTAHPLLSATGLMDYFDAIVTGDMVSKYKPDPEPLATALALLNAPAEKAVMVGDTPLDIQAGKAAGVAMTIGVKTGSRPESLAEADPDVIIDDLLEMLSHVLPGWE